MRAIILLSCILGSLGTAAPLILSAKAAQAQEVQEFFSMLQDVPVMQGLSEIEDGAIVFDKPEGKIIETYADMGGVRKEDVLHYYTVVLPQFGWGQVGDARFFRAGEYLELFFEETDGQKTVKFVIKPSL